MFRAILSRRKVPFCCDFGAVGVEGLVLRLRASAADSVSAGLFTGFPENPVPLN